MRIIYIDIDSLRPDHLGCYGYHRDTSPHIDAIARQAVRFENCYASDAPCLPSRTAMWSGRSGFQTGVVGHGGTQAQPFIEGRDRSFRDQFAESSWMSALASAGLRTVTISSFAQRHAAWHWYAGFSEIYDPGGNGEERADEVTPLVTDWLQRNASTDDWFLHVNLWDAHTPYRTPSEYGDPFEDQPLPPWLTEEVRQACWSGFGPMSAQEPNGYPHNSYAQTVHEEYPRVPAQLDSMAAVEQWINGYDTGIRYADEHIGQILNALAENGVLDETIIIISADHGENLGELNIWGDHQTADSITCRVPLIVRWPGVTDEPRVDNALHYHFDWAATLIDMVGGQVPGNWDGLSFGNSFSSGKESGRDNLILSQGAWACQRSVRFNNEGQAYLCMMSYHGGHKQLEPLVLFNLTDDPHEQHDLSRSHPELVEQAVNTLNSWIDEQGRTSHTGIDPMVTVLEEGGPFHTRGHLSRYLDHLRATGRNRQADWLVARYPDEA